MNQYQELNSHRTNLASQIYRHERPRRTSQSPGVHPKVKPATPMRGYQRQNRYDCPLLQVQRIGVRAEPYERESYMQASSIIDSKLLEDERSARNVQELEQERTTVSNYVEGIFSCSPMTQRQSDAACLELFQQKFTRPISIGASSGRTKSGRKGDVRTYMQSVSIKRSNNLSLFVRNVRGEANQAEPSIYISSEKKTIHNHQQSSRASANCINLNGSVLETPQSCAMSSANPKDVYSMSLILPKLQAKKRVAMQEKYMSMQSLEEKSQDRGDVIVESSSPVKKFVQNRKSFYIAGPSERSEESSLSALSPKATTNTNIKASLKKPQSENKERLAVVKQHLLVTLNPEIDMNCAPKQGSESRLLFLPSAYEHRPPTVLFHCPEKLQRGLPSSRAFSAQLNSALKYKDQVGYDCLKVVFQTSGLEEVEKDEEEGEIWDICWGWIQSGEAIQQLTRHQRLNHFPGSKTLGRKDSLWKNIARMKNKFSQDYNFMPHTFLLSTDHLLFQTYQQNAANDALWIAKPVASACGKGIYLVNKTSRVVQKANYLISNYISNPHLINGLKYDLRVYVLVTCYDPLRIYIFNEGLVRFATEAYSPEKAKHKNKFSHLTNYAINKESASYRQNQSVEGNDDDGTDASKWTFSQYQKRLAALGIEFDPIWADIKDVIIKTIISAESSTLDWINRTPEHNKNCFELYGFDILLDSDLKPWLMEVNVYPSLRTDSHLDKVIKTRLICDTLNLAGLRTPEVWKSQVQTPPRGVQSPRKNSLGKYVRDIDAITEENIHTKLSIDDWEMLFESEEERYRQGDYELIFPLRENISLYKKFFEVERYNNHLLWITKRFKSDPLTKITPLNDL